MSNPNQIDHTVKEAARQLNATVFVIRQAILEGRLRSYKISPRNTRITQAALDEFKANGGCQQ